jgi:hypothetical protein
MPHATDEVLVLRRAAAQSMQIATKRALPQPAFEKPYLAGVYPSIYGFLSH